MPLKQMRDTSFGRQLDSFIKNEKRVTCLLVKDIKWSKTGEFKGLLFLCICYIRKNDCLKEHWIRLQEINKLLIISVKQVEIEFKKEVVHSLIISLFNGICA